MTKDELLALIANKPHFVLCDTQHRKCGEFEGLPLYEVIYEKPPKEYALVVNYSHLKCAVLEDINHGKEI